jgi:hypothetical protein
MKEILIFLAIKLLIDLFIRISKLTANTIDDVVAQWLKEVFQIIKPIIKKKNGKN